MIFQSGSDMPIVVSPVPAETPETTRQDLFFWVLLGEN